MKQHSKMGMDVMEFLIVLRTYGIFCVSEVSPCSEEVPEGTATGSVVAIGDLVLTKEAQWRGGDFLSSWEMSQTHDSEFMHNQVARHCDINEADSFIKPHPNQPMAGEKAMEVQQSRMENKDLEAMAKSLLLWVMQLGMRNAARCKICGGEISRAKSTEDMMNPAYKVAIVSSAE